MKKVGFWLLIIILVSLSLSLTSIKAVESSTNKFCITSIDPETLHPSEVSTVTITLRNIGSASAYYITSEVLTDEKCPVKVLGRAKKSLESSSSFNSLGGNREAAVSYDFYVDKDAGATVYHIPLLITWSEELEGLRFKNETLYFGIRVGGQSKEAIIDVLTVTTVPGEIEPGTKASLVITFKNIGYSTCRLLNARLHAEYPFTPLGSDLNEYIEDVKPGETATAYYTIAVDNAAPSSYFEIPLIIAYNDDFGAHRSNTTIGISVKGAPRILIQEIILEPTKLTTDTQGLFMIRLINTGTESAEDTKIRISGAAGILTEEHQFIGKIAPGASQTATFGVAVGEETELGKHGLMISISYEDKSGVSYSNSKIYETSIFEYELIPPEYIYAAIALALVSIILYFILMRLKK